MNTPDVAAGRDERIDALPPATAFECGVCWWVYTPEEGEPVWQIPPGTPFAELPPHWTCPVCSAEQHKFLPLAA